jgi:uncharacterized SAM-binding protein YcdF (DUF218 family)
MRRGNAAGHRQRGWLGQFLLVLLVAALGWTLWVCYNIESVGRRDDAQKADAIAVFGAAEYEGHPSPVLRARLQHTLELYQRGIAPLIITLGGADDMEHSEGGVGRSFLTAHGVPASAVVAETLSDTTEESVTQLAAIAQARHLQKIVVVSDAAHLFRVLQMCRAKGLNVYTSPRPAGKGVGRGEQFSRLMHEVLSYTLWRLHVT